MLILDKLDVEVEYEECLEVCPYDTLECECTLPVGELGALTPNSAYIEYVSRGDCCTEGKNPADVGDLGSG